MTLLLQYTIRSLQKFILKSAKVLKTAANKKKIIELFGLRVVMGWELANNTLLYSYKIEDFHITRVKISAINKT